jgi:hypothetical protein
VSALDEAPHVHADDRETWRRWLEANHATATGVWLVTWRARTGRVRLDYEAAVEEALCFGWVDSTGGHLDDERGKLYFALRKLRSPWAATNKARVYGHRIAIGISDRTDIRGAMVLAARARHLGYRAFTVRR